MIHKEETMHADELMREMKSLAAAFDQLDETQRPKLLVACKQLRSSLESPIETTLRTLMGPMHAIGLRLGVDMGLFDAAVALSAGGSEVEIKQLASKTGAEPLLITRIIRLLSGDSLQVFRAVSTTSYTVMPLARVVTSVSPMSSAIIHMTAQFTTIAALPTYFEMNGYKSPTDAFNGPFQQAHNTALHSFEWLAQQPRLQHHFNITMSTWRRQRGPRWYEVFPVSERLSLEDTSKALIVDIGGGVGHDMVALKDVHPQLKGRLIVQDIRVVVKDAKDLPAGIEAMEHDFFAPQPIQGAKAYFLGNVLHDWPDMQAEKIMGNIRDAMSEDSILLIWENVLPESNVSQMSAATDFIMMAGFSSLERTLEQYRAVLEKSGLELVHIWRPDATDKPGLGGHALLEAKKVQV